ncbi:hypothetical protein PBI_VALIDUS_46 [Mycobacterium phage Validus]|uniref:Uncharacterized protein n=1 Tax=Mycobacterium phage Validus TaxID=1414747 RepID=V5UPW4_9CAUD|nr:hypothetical protein CC50_gp065 [Mycobacterium phage Validus]AHB79576.1 hypothetical protein PBI_VALIDUS_46 [Mycobacterium phage Validus]
MLETFNIALRSAVLILMAGVVHYRRLSWSMPVPYERGITLFLALQAVGLWLSGPLPTFGLCGLLHQLTGVEALDDLLGPLFYVLSFAVLAVNMLYRVADDDADGARLAWWAVLVPTLGVSVPVMLWSFSQASGDASVLLNVHPEAVLRIYQCASFGAVGWLSFVAYLALRIIATDHAQRQVARDWQITLHVGITGAALGVADALTPGVGLGRLTWWGTAAVGAATALIAARSWHRQMRSARKLLHATRTTRRELDGDTIEAHRLRVMLASETILGPPRADEAATYCAMEGAMPRGDDSEGPLLPAV